MAAVQEVRQHLARSPEARSSDHPTGLLQVILIAHNDVVVVCVHLVLCLPAAGVN